MPFLRQLRTNSNAPSVSGATVTRRILLCRTGSFLKGYIPDKVSYVVKSLLSPADLGTVKIEITPRREKSEGKERQYLDLHASI